MPLSYASMSKSLQVQTQAQRTQRELSSSYAKLSSGLRIVDPSDDAAGYALATLLKTESNLSTVAIRNANDGISIASVADSALNEIQSILYRLGELAGQSASGTYTNAQRSAFSTEFFALGSEIDRIAKTTKYNNINLLSNSSNIVIQVGVDGSANSQITIQSVIGTLRGIGLSNSGDSSVQLYSLNGTTSTYAQNASNLALSAVRNAIDSVTVARGYLGAAEQRLQSSINLLTAQRDNLDVAASRIMDVDVAAETTKLVRLQIIQAAQTALIAQANQEPRLLLQLIG